MIGANALLLTAIEVSRDFESRLRASLNERFVDWIAGRSTRNPKRAALAVPGIGAILIGEGDLSQELGHPREYEHPVVAAAKLEVVRLCKKHGVPVGHPHVDNSNVQRVIDDGYRILMPAPVRSFASLDKARELAKR